MLTFNCTDKTQVEIAFTMLHNPPKFKIDPYLQKVVKMETGTRTCILEAIWQYVKVRTIRHRSTNSRTPKTRKSSTPMRT